MVGTRCTYVRDSGSHKSVFQIIVVLFDDTYYYYYRTILYCTELYALINYVQQPIISNYVLHCFWMVVVLYTTMFLFVKVFFVSLHGDQCSCITPVGFSPTLYC